jgi:transcriptional regulator with XRE-family HTH domain
VVTKKEMPAADDTMGQRIARQLQVKNLSQSGLARALKVSKIAVSQWVRDFSKPTPVNLLNIAAVLFDHDVHYLVRGVKRAPAVFVARHIAAEDHTPAKATSEQPSLPSLAERLKWAMSRADMNGAELAKACGVSAASVSGWVRGIADNIRLPYFFAAARALGVDPEWLATGKGASTGADDRNLAIGKTRQRRANGAAAPPQHLEFVRIYTQLPEEQRAEIRRLLEMIEAFAARKP